jgi:DNA-binding GntR family transcriptional regulator
MVQQISRQMNISRTPVREAIVRLVEEGLVEAIEGKKFKVSAITPKMLNDIYEMRGALECIAVASAAQRHSDQDVEELSAIIQNMQHALIENNNRFFFEQDNCFHTKIIQLHGNKLMLDSLNKVNAQQQRIRYLSSISPYERMRNTILEHRAIVNLIKENDSQGAVEAMTIHLRNVQKEFGELLGSFPPFLTMQIDTVVSN